MKKFIALLKAEVKGKAPGTVYWIEAEGVHYVGTSHFIAKLGGIPDDLRKALASVGVYEANNTSKGGAAPLNAIKVLENANSTHIIADTTLRHNDDYRLLWDEVDKRFITTNNAYYSAFAEMFPDQTMYGKGPLNPILFGNVGLILPIKTGSEFDKVLMTYLKGRDVHA